jgi:hypothetical protein
LPLRADGFAILRDNGSARFEECIAMRGVVSIMVLVVFVFAGCGGSIGGGKRVYTDSPEGDPIAKEIEQAGIKPGATSSSGEVVNE